MILIFNHDGWVIATGTWTFGAKEKEDGELRYHWRGADCATSAYLSIGMAQFWARIAKGKDAGIVDLTDVS